MDKNSPFAILLFIFGIVCATVIARNICDNVENKSIIPRLKKYLFCEYDPDVRPVQDNNNVTRVSFRLMPNFFKYDTINQIFNLHAWVRMEWNDSHLVWDPARYENINGIPVISDRIWIPDILPHNTARTREESDYEQVKCWVSKKGRIEWVTPTKFSTYCVGDNTWWPYDIRNCTIQFASWSHTGDEIEFIPYMNTNLSSKNLEWDLLNIYATKTESRYKYDEDSAAKMFSYHFIIRRHWSLLRIVRISSVLIPMAVLTLMTLWLEPKSLERTIIANLNFVWHILCMLDIHWVMSISGSNVPKLLIFYENSLAIATFSLILTSILRHLQELTTEPPVWISNGSMSIVRSRVGRILLISILDPAATTKIEADVDDNTDLVESNTKKSPWRYVVVLVGWLAFLTIFLVYIILLSTCFPTYHTVS